MNIFYYTIKHFIEGFHKSYYKTASFDNFCNKTLIKIEENLSTIELLVGLRNI